MPGHGELPLPVAKVSKIMNWPKLILASASPRRAQLLKQVGADFIVRPVNIDEGGTRIADPARLSMELAKRKALEAKNLWGRRERGRFILAADTVVSFRHHLLGKPQSMKQAASMLRLLSGQRHQVITGLCLISPDGRMACRCEKSSVLFRDLSRAQIAAYVRSGEPRDKAGAYGIQGRGALLVKSISGCYFNVVGLPLVLLDEMIDFLRKQR